MARTAEEMRAYIRSTLEVSATELTDALVNAWLQEAHSRISTDKRLPFFDKDYSFDTVAGDQTYTLSAIGSDLAEVQAIHGPRYSLQYIAHDDAKRMWPSNVAAGTQTEPTHWSRRVDDVVLWPTPNAVYSMQVEGLRKPAVFPSPATTPDLPEEFHDAVQLYALAKAYAQQDDAPMSALLMTQFDQLLRTLTNRHTAPPHPRPLVMNGGRRRGGGASYLRASLRYPFD